MLKKSDALTSRELRGVGGELKAKNEIGASIIARGGLSEGIGRYQRLC